MNKVRKKDSDRESVRFRTAFPGHPDVQVSFEWKDQIKTGLS